MTIRLLLQLKRTCLSELRYSAGGERLSLQEVCRYSRVCAFISRRLFMPTSQGESAPPVFFAIGTDQSTVRVAWTLVGGRIRCWLCGEICGPVVQKQTHGLPHSSTYRRNKSAHRGSHTSRTYVKAFGASEWTIR